jgi:AcrR family transcriptional regulator
MTKKQPRDQRIDTILQAAVEEFMQKGFQGTSMEAIARRAGLSKGGLYHHFSSKDEILIEANQLLNQPVGVMMETASLEPSPSTAISNYIEQYLTHWQKHQKELVFFFLSFTKILDSPGLWQMYTDYMAKYIHFFENLYQRGMDKGEFIDNVPYESALTLTAALDGITGHFIFNQNIELKEIIRHFQTRFVHSLKSGYKKVKGDHQ